MEPGGCWRERQRGPEWAELLPYGPDPDRHVHNDRNNSAERMIDAGTNTPEAAESRRPGSQ
jgi:hypothetical protein